MSKIYLDAKEPDFNPEEIQIAIDSLRVVKLDQDYLKHTPEHRLDSKARMTFDYRGKSFSAPVNRRVEWTEPGGSKALLLANMLATIIWKDPNKYLPSDIKLEILLKSVESSSSNNESKRSRKRYRDWWDDSWNQS